MIENYIGNFPLPLGVRLPNMVINGEPFIVPFVTEESSVIASASKAAKFWAERGGFSGNCGRGDQKRTSSFHMGMANHK